MSRADLAGGPSQANDPSLALCARTPVEAELLRLGARLVARDGWAVANYPERAGALDDRLLLADESANGKLLVEGLAASEVIAAGFGAAGQLKVGAGIECPMGDTRVWFYRLRADRFFVATRPGEQDGVVERLPISADPPTHLAVVTDVTHGRSEIVVAGRDCLSFLSKLCALPFEHPALGNGSARETSVAKVHQLVLRRDIGQLPAVVLIGARSYARYLWAALFEAGAEFGMRPVTLSELDRLRGLD